MRRMEFDFDFVGSWNYQGEIELVIKKHSYKIIIKCIRPSTDPKSPFLDLDYAS